MLFNNLCPLQVFAFELHSQTVSNSALHSSWSHAQKTLTQKLPVGSGSVSSPSASYPLSLQAMSISHEG